MLSETCFRPSISRSMRASMAFRLSASRSNSSPVPVTSSRPERSPATKRLEVSAIEVDPLQHAPRHEDPGDQAKRHHQRGGQDQRAPHEADQRVALADVAPDERAHAVGKLRRRGPAPYAAPSPARSATCRGRSAARPSTRSRIVGRNRLDVAGDALAVRVGDEIEAGAGLARCAARPRAPASRRRRVDTAARSTAARRRRRRPSAPSGCRSCCARCSRSGRRRRP